MPVPELPDVTVYVESLAERFVGESLLGLRLASPFVLRSISPRPSACVGKEVQEVFRLGKRIVFGLSDDHFIVIHLMVAGRFRLTDPGKAIPKRMGLASFDFEEQSVLLTEASTKKRASIHIVQGREELQEHDRGGLDVLAIDLPTFSERLTKKNHTLKRALTDPRIFSGIGNAYSDEILFHAKLSPIRWTSRLTETQIATLFEATKKTLTEWTDRLRAEAKVAFPKKVTAFRPEMAVHGKYKAPCPVCDKPVQRIVYASNETNYCPTCQNDGKLLKDRSLSRLLKDDWPKTAEELDRGQGA